MAYYVIDDNNNKVEAYTKEEILSVLQQAIEDGTLATITADAGFITKLKCCVTGTTIKEAFVTQAKYNELVAADQLEANTIYTIIDDTTAEDIDTELATINQAIESAEAKINTINQKLKYTPKTAVVNGAYGVNIELEFNKTYVFTAMGATFLLSIAPKPTDTSTIGKTFRSQIAMSYTNYLKIFLEYKKQVSNEGSTLLIYANNDNNTDIGWHVNGEQVEITYYELGKSEVSNYDLDESEM